MFFRERNGDVVDVAGHVDRGDGGLIVFPPFGQGEADGGGKLGAAEVALTRNGGGGRRRREIHVIQRQVDRQDGRLDWEMREKINYFIFNWTIC